MHILLRLLLLLCLSSGLLSLPLGLGPRGSLFFSGLSWRLPLQLPSWRPIYRTSVSFIINYFKLREYTVYRPRISCFFASNSSWERMPISTNSFNFFIASTCSSTDMDAV